MKLLIKNARVVDPSSPFNGKITDIFIEDGTITQVGDIKSKADKEFSSENLHLSPGWVDIFADFADPGYEFKETLETGANAAAAGGFTDVFVTPNTNPTIHNKATVEYIVQKGQSLPVKVHPIGAITKNAGGKELAEMYDMKASGAVAFSDGINPVQSSGLLMKALQYVKAFNGLLIQVPDDQSINPHGLMNEGIVSTQLGLPGKPAMAEELIVARDIKLARYAESRLHFSSVSTRKSLEYIRRAKDAGIDITCSVTPYHLFFCDEDLAGYNTHLKVNPPLRTRDDRDALREGVMDGTVDCIASHHFPHEYDSKILEFEYAKYGMLSLQTSFPALRSMLPDISQERLVELFSTRPRAIFGLTPITIKEGTEACITLYDPNASWTLAEADLKSKSKNSPFIGVELTGKPLGIINGTKVIFN